MDARVTTSLLSRAATPTGSQLDGLLQRRAADANQRGADRGGDRGVPTLLCASGRGGSGTTMVSALLAMAAAGDGFRVLLIDADEHVGALTMMLGVRARATWADLRGARVAPDQIVARMSTTLSLIPGGAPRTAGDVPPALTAAERRACLRRVNSLAAGMDLVVIDCGARFETVAAAITPHADERLVAVSAGADPIGLASTYALCKAVHARHGALPLDVLVNRHEGSEAVRCFDAIDAGARQFLGFSLHFAGAIPTDPTLETALRAGMSFPDAAAGSPAAIAAHDAVMRALSGTSPTRPGV